MTMQHEQTVKLSCLPTPYVVQMVLVHPHDDGAITIVGHGSQAGERYIASLVLPAHVRPALGLAVLPQPSTPLRDAAQALEAEIHRLESNVARNVGITSNQYLLAKLRPVLDALVGAVSAPTPGADGGAT